MNLSLYAIADEYMQAVSTLSDLDLPDEVIADTLESLQYPLEQKATNVAMFARNLEATADAIKEAEGDMAKRRKALDADEADEDARWKQEQRAHEEAVRTAKG